MNGLKKALVVVTAGALVTAVGSLGAFAAPTSTTANTKVDTVTSATVTDNSAVFIKDASKNGIRVFCISKDMTLPKTLVIAGVFKDTKQNKNDRSMALFAADKNNKVTNFTLTVPSIIDSTPNLNVEGGTIKGDVYVNAAGFNLIKGAKVDGNIYFMNSSYKKAFKLDAASSVTGKILVK